MDLEQADKNVIENVRKLPDALARRWTGLRQRLCAPLLLGDEIVVRYCAIKMQEAQGIRKRSRQRTGSTAAGIFRYFERMRVFERAVSNG
jgi:hypothetical protein